MKKAVYILPLIALILWSFAAPDAEEYRAKLAYIERFTRFVTWPPNKIDNKFTIGLVDNNPFGKTIQKLAETKKIKGKTIEYMIISNEEQVKNLDLVFIPAKHKLELNVILQKAKENGVLTISEQKGFGEKGVMINLNLAYGELKFELNKKSITENGFKVHSKLYKIAKKVIE